MHTRTQDADEGGPPSGIYLTPSGIVIPRALAALHSNRQAEDRPPGGSLIVLPLSLRLCLPLPLSPSFSLPPSLHTPPPPLPSRLLAYPAGCARWRAQWTSTPRRRASLRP